MKKILRYFAQLFRAIARGLDGGFEDGGAVLRSPWTAGVPIYGTDSDWGGGYTGYVPKPAYSIAADPGAAAIRISPTLPQGHLSAAISGLGSAVSVNPQFIDHDGRVRYHHGSQTRMMPGYVGRGLRMWMGMQAWHALHALQRVQEALKRPVLACGGALIVVHHP